MECLFIYLFIFGFGDDAKRARSPHKTGFRGSSVAIVYVFNSFLAHGCVVDLGDRCVCFRERNRHEGMDKDKVSTLQIFECVP